jgi:hypothetical protein
VGADRVLPHGSGEDHAVAQTQPLRQAPQAVLGGAGADELELGVDAALGQSRERVE